MGGIAGGFGRPDAGKINTMLDMIQERGPDDREIYISDDVVLGHNRLVIDDLEADIKSVSNDDGTVGLIYSGEISSYRSGVA